MTELNSQESNLARGIAEIAEELGGTLGVAVRDVTRRRKFDLNSGELFPSASIIKLPILVELMARVESGHLNLTDRATLAECNKVPGSGVLSMMHEGLEVTLDDLAHLMITVSDNTASNLLIDRLGCERINQRLRSMGMQTTTLGRKFYDFEARDRGCENWACAGEMADLLFAIEERTVVSAEACEKMLAIMRKQQLDNKIPRLLLPGTPVANKTGSISTASHDIGIIYSPAGPLALAVLTRDVADAAVAEGGIRHVARLVYECWGTPLKKRNAGKPATSRT